MNGAKHWCLYNIHLSRFSLRKKQVCYLCQKSSFTYLAFWQSTFAYISFRCAPISQCISFSIVNKWMTFVICNYGYKTKIHIEFTLILVHSYSSGNMLSARSPVWRCWMTQRCRRKREHRPGRLTGCRSAEMAVKGERSSITDGCVVRLMLLSSTPSLTCSFTVAKNYRLPMQMKVNLLTAAWWWYELTWNPDRYKCMITVVAFTLAPAFFFFSFF